MRIRLGREEEVVLLESKVALIVKVSMRSDSYSEWSRTFSTDPVSFSSDETVMFSNVQLVMFSCVVNLSANCFSLFSKMRGNVRATVDSEVTMMELRLSVPACTRNNGQSSIEEGSRVNVILVMVKVRGAVEFATAERVKMAVGPPVEVIRETNLVI